MLFLNNACCWERLRCHATDNHIKVHDEVLYSSIAGVGLADCSQYGDQEGLCATDGAQEAWQAASTDQLVEEAASGVQVILGATAGAAQIQFSGLLMNECWHMSK